MGMGECEGKGTAHLPHTNLRTYSTGHIHIEKSHKHGQADGRKDRRTDRATGRQPPDRVGSTKDPFAAYAEGPSVGLSSIVAQHWLVSTLAKAGFCGTSNLPGNQVETTTTTITTKRRNEFEVYTIENPSRSRSMASVCCRHRCCCRRR